MKKKLIWIVLCGLIPVVANANLLGRVNSYYDPSKVQEVQKANSEIDAAKAHEQKLLDMKSQITSKKLSAERIQFLKESNLKALRETEAKYAAEKDMHERDMKTAIAARDAAITSKNQLDQDKAKSQIDRIQVVLDVIDGRLKDLKPQIAEAIKESENAKLDSEVASLGLPSESEIESAKKAIDESWKHYKEVLRENSAILYSGDNGVNAAALSDISLSTATGGGNAIDVNAYQYSISVGKASCDKDGKKISPLLSFGKDVKKCEKEDRSAYRLVPMYLLIHKTVTSSQTAAASDPSLARNTLTNDLLNNSNGGVINLKLVPSIGDPNINGDSPYKPHLSFIGDAGYKHIEQPTPDQKSITYAGAGYIGIGINMEFSIFEKNVDVSQLNAGSIRPAGHLALGAGYYRNAISGVDNTLFTSPVPKYFNTITIGGELQITNVISAVFSHSLPNRIKGPNPLGSFTSIAIKVQSQLLSSP